MHCTILCSAHLCSYMLDHPELELEEPMEQAQAEETANNELTKRKPWCMPPIFLDFGFNQYLYYTYCALSL
jgi:hypothetical protein